MLPYASCLKPLKLAIYNRHGESESTSLCSTPVVLKSQHPLPSCPKLNMTFKIDALTYDSKENSLVQLGRQLLRKILNSWQVYEMLLIVDLP